MPISILNSKQPQEPIQLVLKWCFAFLIFLQIPCEAALVVKSSPVGFRKPTESIALSWTGGNARIHLRASTLPGGKSGFYDSLHLPSQLSDGSYSFKINSDIPSAYRSTDLRIGVNYCVLSDGTQRSQEFILLIESSQAPLPKSPANAAVLQDPSPTFSWSGQAPYYTILVSDEPFKISDSGTVTGISAIWQILTPFSSARYGDADPSGLTGIQAPPLVAGKTYNWLALNNYTGTSGGTSKVASSPQSFTYSPTSQITIPTLNAPKDKDTLKAPENIDFSWNPSPEAVSYKLELLEENQVAGSQADLVVWKVAVTSPQARLSGASSLLRRYQYKWRVYALNDQGAAALSTKRSFFYSIPVATIQAKIVSTSGNAIAYAPVRLSRIGSASSSVYQSGSSDGSGLLEIQQAVLGTYEIRCENVPGYLTRTDTLKHLGPGTSVFNMSLTPAAGKINGRVVGTNGLGIQAALVMSQNAAGNMTQATTNSQGDFQLSLPLGTYSITISADGFDSKAQSTSLGAATPIVRSDFTLTPKSLSLSVNVINAISRKPILASAVQLSQNGIAASKYTDGQGLVSFLIGKGEIIVSASSPGFTATSPTKINVTSNMTLNLALQPGASLVSGRVRDPQKTSLSSAKIMAIPTQGLPISVSADGQGYYELNLAAGEWKVSASNLGYTASTSQALVLESGRTLQDLDLVLTPNPAYARGRVVVQGIGVSDVTVYAGSNQTVSDAGGYFRLSLPAGTYDLNAQKQGYFFGKSSTLSLNIGDSAIGILLSGSANAATLKGTVLSSGKVVAQAQIIYSAFLNGQLGVKNLATADLSGEFQLSVTPGTYKIWGQKEGMLSVDSLTIQAIAGGVANGLNVNLKQNTARIQGKVLSGASAIPSCPVMYRGQPSGEPSGSTLTDGNGHYSLAITPGIIYQITSTCLGYLQKSYSSKNLQVNEESTLDFNLSKAQWHWVGKMLDTKGNGVAGVNVSAQSGLLLASTITAVDGSYELDLASGNWGFSFTRSGYASKTRNLSFPISGSPSIQDTLKSSLGKLSVQITNGGSGLENALIRLSPISTGSAKTIVSDADGRGDLGIIAAGLYQIIAEHSGYVSKSTNITLAADAVSQVNIPLILLKGKISGTVKSQGESVSQATVSMRHGSEEAFTLSNSSGNFTFDSLPSGIYQLQAYAQGYASGITIDSLVLNESEVKTNQELTMNSLSASIRGKIVGADNPIGFKLNLIGKKGYRIQLVGDAQGNFQSPSIAADSYTLTSAIPGWKVSGEIGSTGQSIDKALQQDISVLTSTFSITGVLKNHIDQIVPGIPIKAENGSWQGEAVTNSQGVFNLVGVPTGAPIRIGCQTQVKIRECIESSLPNTIQAGDKITVNLKSINRQSSLTGVVTLDDKPLVSASITVQSELNNQNGKSNGSGVFTFSNLAGGVPIHLKVVVTGSKAIDTILSPALGAGLSGIELKLHSVQSKVTLKLLTSLGKALTNTYVTLKSATSVDSVKTDLDGNALFTGRPANTSYSIAYGLPQTEYEASNLVLLMGENDTSLTLSVIPHRTKIIAKTLDDSDNEINDVSIYLNGTFMGKSTNGTYSIPSLPADIYSVSGTRNGYASSISSNLTLSGDTSITVMLHLTEISQGITGIVTDSILNLTGDWVSRNLAGVELRLNLGSQTRVSQTDAGGRFAFANPGTGAGSLEIAVPGHAYFSETITLDNSVLSKPIFIKAERGTYSGQVTRLASTDKGIVMAWASNGLERKLSEIGKDGWFALTGLEPNHSYYLQAQNVSDGQSASETQIISGGIYPKGGALNLQKGAEIQVTVGLQGTSRPAMGALVWLVQEGKKLAVSKVGLDGKSSLVGVQPGPYEILVELPGFENNSIHQVVVEKGATTINLSLSLQSTLAGIGGQVIDARGMPLVSEIRLTASDGTFQQSITDENGFFNWQGQPAGVYSIRAIARGYATFDSTQIEFNGQSRIYVPMVLNPLGDSLWLKVVNAVTGQPIPEPLGVLRTAVGADTVRGDSAGFVGLKWNSQLIGYLSISSPDYLAVQDLVVRRDSLVHGSIPIALAPDYQFDGSIRVQIRDQGNSVNGAVVEVRSLSYDDSPVLSISGDAANTFQGLRYPADYKVSIRRTDYRELSQTISLSRSTQNMDLSFKYPNSRVQVQLTRDGQSPMNGWVRAQGKNLPESDSAGLYIHPDRLGASRFEMEIGIGDSRYLEPESYFLSIGEDTLRTDSIEVPFSFIPILDTALGVDIPIKVMRAELSQVEETAACTMWVKGPNLNWVPIPLASDHHGFSGIWQPEGRPGLYSAFYSVTRKKGLKTFLQHGSVQTFHQSQLIYSNRNQPMEFRLRDPKILTSIRLLPTVSDQDTLTYDLSGHDLWEVEIFGEAGLSLNSFTDRLKQNPDTAYPFSVEWSFEDEESAKLAGLKISPSDSSERLCLFQGSPKTNSQAHSVSLVVRLGAITVRKQFFIRIEDLSPAFIGIRSIAEGTVLSGNSIEYEIPNTSVLGVRFEAFAKTFEGREFRIQPRWSLGSDSSAGTLSQTGLFIPRKGVARSAKISIYDTLNNEKGRFAFTSAAHLKTVANLIPADTGVVQISDGEGLQLTFPLGGLSKAFSISVSRPNVNPLLRASPNEEVVGDVHEIELSESQPFKADSGAFLTLPVSSGLARQRKVYVGHWNSSRLVWERMDSTTSDTVAQAKVASFSKYAVIMGSLPLGAYDFEVVPNPFTPLDPWGLQFHYTLSSEVSSQVGIRIEVFNMVGDKVYSSREVLVSKGEEIKPGTYKANPSGANRRDDLGPYVWDGRDNHGALCRNGRYVLRMIVRDGKGSKEYLRKVVVIQ